MTKKPSEIPEVVARIVAAAPPITPEQRRRLLVLLAGDAG